jgi:hypothetical protein
MTMPAATWTYSDFTLTHVASQQSVTIDVAANIALHEILSAQHWYTPPEFKENYSDDPDDWTERSIRWNRAQEDPPVLGVEQNIGAGDYEDYTVIELEDDASFGPILDDIATILQDGHDGGFSPAHARELLKSVARAFQLGGLIG